MPRTKSATPIQPIPNVVVKGDPVVMTATGESYETPPVKDGKDAMRAVVHMMLKHTADMLITMVDIIADEYKLDREDMMKTVLDHPKYKDMYVNPVIYDLGYLPSRTVAAEAANASADPVTAATEQMATLELEATPSEASAPAKKAKKGWSEEAKASAAAKRAAKKAAGAATSGAATSGAATSGAATSATATPSDAGSVVSDAGSAPILPKKRVLKKPTTEAE